MKDKQCAWICPVCHSRCGGSEGHDGPHQCPIHYKPQNLKRETKRKKKRLGCSAPIIAPRCDKYTPEEGCIASFYCNYQFEEVKE